MSSILSFSDSKRIQSGWSFISCGLNSALLGFGLTALQRCPHTCLSDKVKVLVAQSCPTLWDPMDCGLPDSTVHGIFLSCETSPETGSIELVRHLHALSRDPSELSPSSACGFILKINLWFKMATGAILCLYSRLATKGSKKEKEKNSSSKRSRFF